MNEFRRLVAMGVEAAIYVSAVTKLAKADPQAAVSFMAMYTDTKALAN